MRYIWIFAMAIGALLGFQKNQKGPFLIYIMFL